MRTQEADGSWYGRWGVDYIYGTFLALRGLQAAGESDREAYIQRALRMGPVHPELRRRLGRKLRQLRQQAAYVAAPSTPSQTAWAILGLLAGGDTTSTSLHDGIEYLIERRRATEAGTRIWPPAPDSRRSSTCSITFTAIRFPCWL